MPIAQQEWPGRAFSDPALLRLAAHSQRDAAFVRDQMAHSSIEATFDTYKHLFHRRGKKASERYEVITQPAR
jgi:integrase